MSLHLALGDVAAFRFKNVFDRVFESDDVFAAFEVHLLDESRERGRFAGADGTCDENEAVLVTRQQLETFRQTKFIHGPHLSVDDAEHEIDSETLPDHACPETADLIRVSEV